MNLHEYSQLFLKIASDSSFVTRERYEEIKNNLFGLETTPPSALYVLRKFDMYQGPKAINKLHFILKSNGQVYQNMLLDTHGGIFLRPERKEVVLDLYSKHLEKTSKKNKKRDVKSMADAYAIWDEGLD